MSPGCAAIFQSGEFIYGCEVLFHHYLSHTLEGQSTTNNSDKVMLIIEAAIIRADSTACFCHKLNRLSTAIHS